MLFSWVVEIGDFAADKCWRCLVILLRLLGTLQSPMLMASPVASVAEENLSMRRLRRS